LGVSPEDTGDGRYWSLTGAGRRGMIAAIAPPLMNKAITAKGCWLTADG
jgi:hypothetical protein